MDIFFHLKQKYLKLFQTRKRSSLLALVLMVAFLMWLFSLPARLFPETYSTVMYDNEGKLLNARVAADGQWRFPESNSIPEKYRIALLNYEDRYFIYHPGFNPLSFLRAARQNFKSRNTISGGSTITMQVIRLHRQGKKRSLPEKLMEVFLATRLELRHSKTRILNLYASHAPFGGNVVGLQAASWRYFGHSQSELSWAEAAALAVLPNSPALIFPGRNQELLKAKRDRLLKVLHERGYLDEITLNLSMAEPLPGKPYPLPQHAPHLFTKAIKDGLESSQIQTTIDAGLQKRVEELMIRYHQQLRTNHIENIAVLVAEVNSGKVLVYWGNTPEYTNPVPARQVDVIDSRRSPGSLLKPFLYAGLLQEGMIMPSSLVPDIPTQYQGFTPENFARTFDGAVSASRALARSLNVPAVRMLREYHPDKFLTLLQSCGMNTFNQPASHYGLSLILGGAEITMWEVAGAYASMARSMNAFDPYLNIKAENEFRPLSYTKNKTARIAINHDPPPFSPSVAWHTFEAMVEAARPDTEANWQRFAGSRRIAWKTGTSYGYRDAWAVGIDPRYVVAIWVGNASGEGRPGLTGIAAAAPIMFDVFGFLPGGPWFSKPFEDMKQVSVCRLSGYPAGQFCEPLDTIMVPNHEFHTGPCPFHRIVHLDKNRQYRVNTSCEPWADIVSESWFVLPPVQEYYFKNRNPFYRPLPPFRADCVQTHGNPMQWIYPMDASVIFIPIELDGSPGEAIFRIAHQQIDAVIHWHLNENYIGSTENFHEMAMRPQSGSHRVTVVDESGNMLSREFRVRVRD
jgi:penicillin-binding protein 1C